MNTKSRRKKFTVRKKRISYLIFLSFLHSCLLILFTLILLDSSITYGDERVLFSRSTVLKKMLLGLEDMPERKEFLFINVSYDNMLIDFLDEDGFVRGNQTVTDRKKLSDFFNMLEKNPEPYKFVFCDIFFKDSSSYDSVLHASLLNTKNIIIPYKISENGNIDTPIFSGVLMGHANYEKIGGLFLKYELISYDSLRSLPLLMYERIYKEYLYGNGLFLYMNGKPSFNNIIIDFKIRYFYLFSENTDSNYAVINLGEIIELPPEKFNELTKNRIIIIGDFFQRDFHQTILGPVPGPLILLNIFLALREKENIINPLFILLLLLSYFIITLDVFTVKKLKNRKYISAFAKSKIGSFTLTYLGYLLYLTFISYITYFIFNIHINILILAVYLKALELIINFLRKKKSKDKSKHIFELGKNFIKEFKTKKF